MENTCIRCHRTVIDEDCYCPACGLPQFVYTAEDSQSGQAQPERWNEAAGVRDAGSVAWNPALRYALLLAVPAGLLCSGLSRAGNFGLFWMATGAGWAVVLYARSQKAPWITVGAGARIGLVTGLLAGWLAFGFSGGALFIQRFLLHHSSQIDADWKARIDVTQQVTQQVFGQTGMTDGAQLQAQRAWMLSPEGHAGLEVFGFASSAIFLLIFATAGGALGARLLARTRRPEI